VGVADSLTSVHDGFLLEDLHGVGVLGWELGLDLDDLGEGTLPNHPDEFKVFLVHLAAEHCLLASRRGHRRDRTGPGGVDGRLDGSNP